MYQNGKIVHYRNLTQFNMHLLVIHAHAGVRIFVVPMGKFMKSELLYLKVYLLWPVPQL